MFKNKKTVIALALLVVAVIAALVIWQVSKPTADSGLKTIVVEVVPLQGDSEEFTIETDSENLRGALESINLVEGSESDYGLFITTVNDITADDSLEQWWCITKGGETLMTGVDDTVIADGEHYELTLTEGY